MTQDEWLFKLVNIKKKEIKGKVGGERPDGTGFDLNLRYPVQPNIKDLTSAERKQIIEKMENYWKEHRPSSLEYLAKYMLLCDNKQKLCQIINNFFNKPDFALLSTAVEWGVLNSDGLRLPNQAIRECDLLNNYDLLLQKAEDLFQNIVDQRGRKSLLQGMGMWIDGVDTVARVIENRYLLAMIKELSVYISQTKDPAIESITELDSVEAGIERYYGNGIDIKYWTIDPITSVRPATVKPAHTRISRVKINTSTSDIEKLWQYFGKHRATLFVQLFVLNIAATALLATVPAVVSVSIIDFLVTVPAALAASIAWTVVSTLGGAALEGEMEKNFEKMRYEQSRADLGELLEQLRVYTIFSNNDENPNSFIYQIFPGSETETIVNNFLDNISRIYIKEGLQFTEEKCLIDILELNKVTNIPLKLKIDCLIAALTLDTMTNIKIFGRDSENDKKKKSILTGIELINKLEKLTLDSKEYLIQVQVGHKRVNIDETTCFTNTKKNRGHMDVNKLFAEILKERNATPEVI